jgi:hypothetical protein
VIGLPKARTVGTGAARKQRSFGCRLEGQLPGVEPMSAAGAFTPSTLQFSDATFRIALGYDRLYWAVSKGAS